MCHHGIPGTRSDEQIDDGLATVYNLQQDDLKYAQQVFVYMSAWKYKGQVLEEFELAHM